MQFGLVKFKYIKSKPKQIEFLWFGLILFNDFNFLFYYHNLKFIN